MQKDSFIFYRSFYEALIGMDKDSQADCLMAIADYALNGKEPILTPEVRMFFTLVKPQIDANQKRFENGCKGGRPKKENNKQEESKTKPNNNQTITKIEPNVNDNVNDNVNENYNVQFEEFWKAYTPIKCDGRFIDKGSKKTAQEKFIKILKKGEKYENIINGCREYIEHCKRNNQLTCGVAVFLNKERWKDDYSGSSCESANSNERPKPRSYLEIYSEIAAELAEKDNIR